jgi:hypothetical protein
MGLKLRIVTAAAALAVAAGGAAIAAPLTASAATPSCGSTCISAYVQKFGPQFILDSKGQGRGTGTEVILFQASNSDPAEDWSYYAQGTVNSFGGLVSRQVKLHYGTDEAYEIEYTPLGQWTGECAGTATTAGDGTKVSLQPCGDSSKTLWIADAADAEGSDIPLIAGSDDNFSTPYVLTYPGGYPTDTPRPQLETWGLQKFSAGVVNDAQEWGFFAGVTPWKVVRAAEAAVAARK